MKIFIYYFVLFITSLYFIDSLLKLRFISKFKKNMVYLLIYLKNVVQIKPLIYPKITSKLHFFKTRFLSLCCSTIRNIWMTKINTDSLIFKAEIKRFWNLEWIDKTTQEEGISSSSSIFVLLHTKLCTSFCLCRIRRRCGAMYISNNIKYDILKVGSNLMSLTVSRSDTQ